MRLRRWRGLGTGTTESSALRIRMLRVGQDFGGRADLDDAPQIHDGDAVGEESGGRQIVGDVEDGDAAFVAQVAQQVEDFGADRHVEHRDRLVGDQQLRIEDQRAGDADALALPAG